MVGWVEAGVGLVGLVVVVVMIVARRARVRAWRFGVFYESDHDDDPPGDAHR